MASNSTEYLRFSAYSLKELITRKLAADTKFTDQVYEGSNLAILIDIVCYMYQCLMYNVNNAAAEAMWSDTLIYENINRLAKTIGYNPKGATPATAVFTLDLDPMTDLIMPKYACIDTKKTDDNGNKIYYSTVLTFELTKESNDLSVLFYNGLWKMYTTVFLSTGQQYQTLLLDQLTSDDSKQTYVSELFIDIYVMDPISGKIKQWIHADNLFIDNDMQNKTAVYSQNDEIYSVRLNENKQYEITFGNGFNGKIPEKGSEIYVFYLESNSPNNIIELDEVQDAKIKHDASLFGIDDNMYSQMFSILDDNEIEKLELLKEQGKWHNTSSSTEGKVEESVDDIRKNAPALFKIGNRLVTAADWQYYVKNRFSDNILDVVCLNNWTYMSTFYRWLYDLGMNKHYDGKYYLVKNRLIKYDYKWADSADVNNIYLWIKMKNDADIYKNTINNDVNEIKVMTQEPVYLKPLDVSFAICAQDISEVIYLLKNNDTSFSGNYLEITIDDNTLYANTDILQQVLNIFKEYFSESNFTIGCTINCNDIANKIFALGTVSRIRTIYKNTVSKIERIFPGISLASWTSEYIDIGDDADVTTSSKPLEPFLFPKLLNSSLVNHIKVIRKSVSLLNTISY